MACVIRPCVPADWSAAESMTRDAFWDVYKPGCDEHYLVHLLHEQNAPAPELNLVAELDGEIIGQVICVPARLQCGEKVLDDVLCLGPLTVAPVHQHQGIGTQLMQECIRRAAALGWRAIFLMGNPTYYHRFGYRAASEYAITLPDGAAMEEMMTLPLYPGALDGCAGVYAEPPIYASMTPAAVTVFDQRFSPRAKHVLPTQIFQLEDSSQYELLARQMASLAEGCPLPLPALANCAALLWDAMADINWVGFYLLKGDQLILGPFQGKVACTVIPVGRGVCGTAAAIRKIQLVPDVHQFPGHIACDSASNSEIVLPLMVADRLVGVLDIDSPVFGRFTQTTADGLARLCRVLAEQVNWEDGLL